MRRAICLLSLAGIALTAWAQPITEGAIADKVLANRARDCEYQKQGESIAQRQWEGSRPARSEGCVDKRPLPAQGGLTSVAQLLHPLTKGALKLLESAKAHFHAGSRQRGIDELSEAMQDPGAEPYAHAILGVEYLKVHDIPPAVK